MKRSKGNQSRPGGFDDLSALVGGIEESFSETMRRPPLDGDRLFHWTYCYSDAEFKNIMIKLFINAEIPQHLIYIYDKTGFMVSEEGYKRLSKKERNEIRKANLEYDVVEEETDGDVYKLSDYDDSGLSDETDPLIQALYVLGNFIERNINSGEYKIDVQKFVCGYLIVRAYRLVRAVFRSQRYTTAEEQLVLVRSLYEIYCKLTYATSSKRNAQYLLDSDFGLAFGNYDVLVKNGKPKRHLLIHKKTRRIIPRTRSFYEYISSSHFKEDIDLFEALYEYLSSFVHSGSRHIFKSWTDQKAGFSLTHDNDEYFKAFIAILTCFVSSMIMQSLLSLRSISRVSKWDISLFGYVTRKIITESSAPKESEIAELFPRMKARAGVLPAKVANLAHSKKRASRPAFSSKS